MTPLPPQDPVEQLGERWGFVSRPSRLVPRRSNPLRHLLDYATRFLPLVGGQAEQERGTDAGGSCDAFEPEDADLKPSKSTDHR
jgi:hypothetical protein